MRKIVLALLLVSVMGLGLACAKAPSTSGAPQGTARPGVSPTTAASATSLELPSERMIVRTGNMSLLVEDVVKAVDAVAALAVERGGYVISSSVQGSEGGKKATISFRVTPAEFEATVLALRQMAVRVMTESTSSEDVTQAYVDLQSRLRNLEASEGQLLTFMTRAVTIDDVLKVQRELNTVRGQIEETRGRMQYIERTSAMSLINVTLLPTSSPEALVRQGWNGTGIVRAATRALVIFGQVLGTLVIWLAIFSPVWGTAVGIVWWRQRRARRKR